MCSNPQCKNIKKLEGRGSRLHMNDMFRVISMETRQLSGTCQVCPLSPCRSLCWRTGQLPQGATPAQYLWRGEGGGGQNSSFFRLVSIVKSF